MIPPPKPSYRYWHFKAKLVKEAQAFSVGVTYARTQSEAIALIRQTYGPRWTIIPNGYSTTPQFKS